jgi:hypothetical protein
MADDDDFNDRIEFDKSIKVVSSAQVNSVKPPSKPAKAAITTPVKQSAAVSKTSAMKRVQDAMRASNYPLPSKTGQIAKSASRTSLQPVN